MRQAPIETPVVLILYNRPETTRRVFEQIARVKPTRLLLLADGPRSDHPHDDRLCVETRQIVRQVDWDCSVATCFRDENLGSRNNIVQGLEWVFSEVDSAIVLEDDCVPDPSFFYFCQDLLEVYKDDERIAMIGGTNYQFGNNRLPYSYYYSIYPHIWGWATWARAWKLNDPEMHRWPEARERELLRSLLPDSRASKFWTKRFEATYRGKIDTWDYGWTLSCWLENCLSIVPAVNLVANIGFGKGAVHTTGRRSRLANMPVQEMKFPLAPPPYKIRYLAADLYTQRTVFREHLLAPFKRRIKLLLGV